MYLGIFDRGLAKYYKRIPPHGFTEILVQYSTSEEFASLMIKAVRRDYTATQYTEAFAVIHV